MSKSLVKKKNDEADYINRTLIIDKVKVQLIYSESLCDINRLNNTILKNLFNLDRKKLNKLDYYLPVNNILIINKKEIEQYINLGYAIIITKKIYAVSARNVLDRGISTVQGELSITGPKDAYVENYNTNLGLIRKRIKSTDLKVCDLVFGRSTQTKVGVVYMDNIVDKKLVERVLDVLERVDIDGIVDSSYVKTTLEGQKSYFPTVMMSERPDKSVMALLEGKIVVLVDNSPYALILPCFFIDYFHTTDDYYQKSFNTTFIRIIRLIAFFIAIFTPALYISVTTRNYDIVPLPLLLMLKAGRTFVPFPAYIEAMFMIICFEILKESDLRMSFASGSSISILGGLILGDAAVSAGIVSPIMIIVIAISSIAGLIFSSVELVNAIRIYKILLLFLGTILGIYGVILGVIYISYKLLTLKSFGIPYLIPFIPFEKNEIKDSFIKMEQPTKYRNSFLTKNIVRGKYK